MNQEINALYDLIKSCSKESNFLLNLPQETECKYCNKTFITKEGCSCKCGSNWCINCYTKEIYHEHSLCYNKYIEKIHNQ